MSKIQEAILANAADHTRLLTEIGNLEYIPSAKKHQTSRIDNLEGRLATIEKEVAQLVKKTKKKMKTHDSLRDSTVKKLAYKCFDGMEKYKEKINKAEREYTEALETDERARNNQADIQQLLEEGRNELMDLTEKEQKLRSLKAKLTTLYGRVFDGQKESFPEDDRLKNALHVAEKHHDRIQAKSKSERRAADELGRAVELMDTCQISMQKASKYSTNIHNGHGSKKSIQKLKDALTSAHADASRVDKCVSEAIKASARVKPVTQVDIPLSASEDRIKQLMSTKLIQCNQQVRAEWSSARLRVDEVGEQLEQVLRTLDRCRQELHRFRKATFESYINSSKYWQSMLLIAKNNMRRHVALMHAFPKHEKHEATLILHKTMAEYGEEDPLKDGFTPDRDMNILILSKEHSDFRGKMKEVAREVVKSKYSDLLLPPDFEGYDMVKRNVIGILNHGGFVRGGVDENGKTQNFGHPSIEALALQFYYTGDDCLANLFPEAFDRTIPDHAFALLITCIQNCLEEYADHGYRLHSINFEGDKYRAVYQSYLDMINDCKQNEYHGPRFETCRAEWARKGMRQLKGTDRYTPALCLD